MWKFQVVPHITDAIKDWIESVSAIPVDGKDGPADVCVIELGGTVGKSDMSKKDAAFTDIFFGFAISCGSNNVFLFLLQVTLNLCHLLRLCDSCHFQLVGYDVFCILEEHCSLPYVPFIQR